MTLRMSLVRLVAAFALVLAASSIATAQYVTPPPPPPPAEAVPPPPPGAVPRAWRPGHWRWNGARYVWVGDGPLRIELAAAHPDFIFTGVQRGEALARHYASADLFLFPSLSETFGNVTLEAMASGVAVVAFDHGAAREHIVDDVNGRRITAGDRDDFIAAALELALDVPRRERLGHNARSSVAALAPGTVIAEFEALLRTLAEDSVHGPVATAGA